MLEPLVHSEQRRGAANGLARRGVERDVPCVWAAGARHPLGPDDLVRRDVVARCADALLESAQRRDDRVRLLRRHLVSVVRASDNLRQVARPYEPIRLLERRGGGTSTGIGCTRFLSLPHARRRHTANPRPIRHAPAAPRRRRCSGDHPAGVCARPAADQYRCRDPAASAAAKRLDVLTRICRDASDRCRRAANQAAGYAG